ncbi:MAG: ABC transporter ATP-binding protein [Alphaproteobacteria bacterium]|nr:ABC transporter ATP-binding protein [Alphaproteobacteria bacterium]
MSEVVLSAKGLSKWYGPIAAVSGVDLELHRGEILGMLGPNGAGKTTTILMLLGLTEPSSGTIDVGGFDPIRAPLEVKRRVGYLPDSVGFYDNLTARQNLRYTARLAGLPREQAEAGISAALKRVGLDEVADRGMRTLSHGMRQRLGLAEVLMKGVELAVLDEPTSGLDPQASFDLLDTIRGLKADGTAVLLSSHLLDRVQAVCDRVALFHRGKIVLEGTVPDLARRVFGGVYIFELDLEGDVDAPSLFAALPGVRQATAADGTVRVLADRDVRAELARAAVAAGAALHRLVSVEPSLDAIYRHYFEGRHGTA